MGLILRYETLLAIGRHHICIINLLNVVQECLESKCIVSLHDFQTPQTLHLHIFNDRIMPGVSDVHVDCKTVYRLKTIAVEGLS